MIVEDDGRGFPEQDYPMDIFCTKIQSGSKFFRTQSGGTSGEFGLGLTAVNALSEIFSLESFREKEKYRHLISFKNGKKSDDVKEPITKRKTHGAIVKFKPSRQHLGKGTCIPINDVIDWIDKMSYLIPEGITIKIDVFKGLKLKDTRKFKTQPFVKMLDKISNGTSSICSFSGKDHIKERVKILSKDKPIEKSIDKDIRMDIAIQYTDSDDTLIDSYCNYTNTTEGGIHVDAVDRVFCRYIQDKAKETQTESQREKYKITWDDVRSGLVVIVNLSTGAQVGFVGNAKQRIASEELTPHLVDIVQKGLDKFFNEHQAVLAEYIKIVKLNTKARVEAQKIKTATKTRQTNSWDEHDMDKYIRCNNTGKNQFRELFMVEGDSASGSAMNGSDRNTQAFLLFRGVVANPLKCKNLSEIMENKEWSRFVKILKCGIGPTFDISKLYFDRINIFTDSDADGYGISSGMLVFIYTYLRPLIEAGKVYKVFSPLYRLDDKNHPFVVNKAEIVEIFQKKVAKHYSVELEDAHGNLHPLNKSEMLEFLQNTYEYRNDLDRIAKSLGRTNKFMVEMILAMLVKYGIVRSSTDYDDLDSLFSNQKFIKNFMSTFQSKYPESSLSQTNKTINAIIDGHSYMVKINPLLIRHSEDLIRIYKQYGYRLKVIEKNSKEPTWYSIGEFLDQTTKLMSKIVTRFKGLGELNADEMFSTALDINNRVSIQYTVDDAEKETEIFRKLHGCGKRDIIARRNMMMDYKIARDDLDN
jgi:DNA gyrase/topoisomerase IV subunit B